MKMRLMNPFFISPHNDNTTQKNIIENVYYSTSPAYNPNTATSGTAAPLLLVRVITSTSTRSITAFITPSIIPTLLHVLLLILGVPASTKRKQKLSPDPCIPVDLTGASSNNKP